MGNLSMQKANDFVPCKRGDSDTNVSMHRHTMQKIGKNIYPTKLRSYPIDFIRNKNILYYTYVNCGVKRQNE